VFVHPAIGDDTEHPDGNDTCACFFDDNKTTIEGSAKLENDLGTTVDPA
jgi:hypothetical protein